MHGAGSSREAAAATATASTASPPPRSHVGARQIDGIVGSGADAQCAHARGERRRRWFDRQHASEPELQRFFNFRDLGPRHFEAAGDSAGEVGKRLDTLGRPADAQHWLRADVAMQLCARRHNDQLSDDKLCVTFFNWGRCLQDEENLQRVPENFHLAAEAHLAQFEVAERGLLGCRDPSLRRALQARAWPSREIGRVHSRHAEVLNDRADNYDQPQDAAEFCRRTLHQREAESARHVASIRFFYDAPCQRGRGPLRS